MIKLDIFSDPICPWCYIGKTRLFQALEAHPSHPFEIEWHPFQLNLGMPKGGMDRVAYLEAKFGGQRGAAEAYRPIVETAEAMGLKMNLADIPRTPNTLDAHRVIHWAGQEGRQTLFVQALFEAYFVKTEDIGDHSVLATVAGRAGLNSQAIARLLDSDADVQDIRARDKEARDRGITAVPTFIVGNRHVVPGAQPTELWMQVIEELAENAR